MLTLETRMPRSTTASSSAMQKGAPMTGATMSAARSSSNSELVWRFMDLDGVSSVNVRRRGRAQRGDGGSLLHGADGVEVAMLCATPFVHRRPAAVLSGKQGHHGSAGSIRAWRRKCARARLS